MIIDLLFIPRAKLLLQESGFKLGIFFIQTDFMYEVGKCSRQSWTESLPPLRQRDPLESFPRIIKI